MEQPGQRTGSKSKGERTVNATRLFPARKQPRSEHVQTRDAKSLGARPRTTTRTGFGVRPGVARASVEQDGDEEEVEEAFALFGRGDAGGGPCLEEGCDAGVAGVEVAPSAVGWDLCVGGW